MTPTPGLPIAPESIRAAPPLPPPVVDVARWVEEVNAMLCRPWTVRELQEVVAGQDGEGGSPGRALEVTTLSTPEREALSSVFTAAQWRVGTNVVRHGVGYQSADDGRCWLVFSPKKNVASRLLAALRRPSVTL